MSLNLSDANHSSRGTPRSAVTPSGGKRPSSPGPLAANPLLPGITNRRRSVQSAAGGPGGGAGNASGRGGLTTSLVKQSSTGSLPASGFFGGASPRGSLHARSLSDEESNESPTSTSSAQTPHNMLGSNNNNNTPLGAAAGLSNSSANVGQQQPGKRHRHPTRFAQSFEKFVSTSPVTAQTAPNHTTNNNNASTSPGAPDAHGADSLAASALSPGATSASGITPSAALQSLTQVELANIERTFTEFDEDHSGTMDIGEIGVVMRAMGHSLTPAQVSELVEQVDTSGTGSLNLNDFCQLILLWKEANQFKLFDSSAPSIQVQRINKALKTKLMLSDGKFRLAWDFLMHFVIMYLWGITLYFDFIDPQRFDEWQFYLMGPDLAVVIIFLLDIVVSINTVVRIGASNMLDDRRDTFWRWYAKRWLAIDAFAAIPFPHFGRSPVLTVLSLLRLLKALKLIDSFRYSGRRPMTAFYVTFRLNIMPLVRQLQAFFMAILVFSVMWTLLKQEVPIPGRGSSSAINNSTADDKVPLDFATDWTTSVYFVMVTLTTCGYGDVAIEGPYQQLLACAFCICGTLLQGLVIGVIVTVIQKTDIKNERASKLRETLAVCEYFDIPESLQDEILQFQDHVLSHNLSQAYTDLVRGLPVEMQLNINLFVKIRLVSNVPFFKRAHQGTLVAIAQHLQQLVYLPEQYIVVAGDHGEAMYFISFGFVDVISDSGMQVATLKQGDFFGEMALLSEAALRKASVKALSYCDVFELHRSAFAAVLERFPKFKTEMMQMAEKRLNELQREASQHSLTEHGELRAVHSGSGDSAADPLKTPADGLVGGGSDASSIHQQHQTHDGQGNLNESANNLSTLFPIAQQFYQGDTAVLGVAAGGHRHHQGALDDGDDEMADLINTCFDTVRLLDSAILTGDQTQQQQQQLQASGGGGGATGAGRRQSLSAPVDLDVGVGGPGGGARRRGRTPSIVLLPASPPQTSLR